MRKLKLTSGAVPAVFVTAIGVVILTVALLAGSSDEYRRNAAFAIDSYGGYCPLYENGRCYQPHGIACYEVDCGVNEEVDVIGTPTPIPTPSDLMEPEPEPTDVTPTGTPAEPPQVNVDKMSYDQLKNWLEDSCEKITRITGASDPDDRARLVQEGIDACMAKLKERPVCRWYIGPGYLAALPSLGRFGDPGIAWRYDPVRLLQEFDDADNFRDPGVGRYNLASLAFGWTEEQFDDMNYPIGLYDPYFGWARPLVNCGGDKICSHDELKTIVDKVANRGEQLKCGRPKRNAAERGETICHEIGHRTSEGRHGLLAKHEEYAAIVFDACFK